MVGCTKHQAVEAGGLSSEYERLFWLRVSIQQGEPVKLILIILHTVQIYTSAVSQHLLMHAQLILNSIEFTICQRNSSIYPVLHKSKITSHKYFTKLCSYWMYFWYPMTHENRGWQIGGAKTERRAPDTDSASTYLELFKDSRIVDLAVL